MNTRIISSLCLLVALAACSTAPPGQGDVIPPPNVNGLLNTGGPTKIPFSAYTTGNPVIATEAFVNSATAFGVPQVLTANTVIKSIKENDYFVLFGADTFTLPDLSVAKDGTTFMLGAWKPGSVAVKYVSGQFCFTGFSDCPASLSQGDVYLYQRSGTVWRAMKISGVPLTSTANAWTAAQTLSFTSTATVPTFSLTGVNPQLNFTYDKGALDSKRWDFVTGGSTFSLRGVNDAGGSAVTAIAFTRSGMTITGTQFSTGTLLAGAGYAPTANNSLTDKSYVDGRFSKLPVRFNCYSNSPLIDGGKVCKWISSDSFVFPANFAGSRFAADSVPTVTVTFAVWASQNGPADLVGSLTFTKGSTVGTAATMSGAPLTFAPGDILELRAPSPAQGFQGFTVAFAAN